MYSTIRAEKGLAYVAWSHFVRFEHGGYLAAEMQTKKERTSEAIETMLRVLRGIQDTIHADELERAKNFYTGYFPLTYDSYSELASLVAHIEVENLGLDYIDEFSPAIKQLTFGDLSGAARKYLKPDNFYLLIVGDIKPEDVTADGIEWID
jgi:zinc protease